MDINNVLQNFIEQYGLISIFIIVMLEYANFPLPSEVVLTFVGIMVAKGNISFIGAIIVSVVAGVVGSITNYLIGLYFGKGIIKYLLKKYPKTKKTARASMSWLKKYGKLSVMFTRIVPLARTFISIPAGISKMNIYVFILYSSIGISLWNIVLISLGYMLGDNLGSIAYIMKNYSIIVISLTILGLGVYYRKRKRTQKIKIQ